MNTQSEYKDPRGPLRKIVAIDKLHFNDSGVVLSCGHRPNLNPIYSHRVGDDCRCFACGKMEQAT